MKKLYLLTALSATVFSVHAQTPFWTEDFGSGCNQGTLASSYSGTNGAWTITNTGTNDAEANNFFVSAAEAGMGAGNCGDGCVTNGTLTNATLHVGNAAITSLGIQADNGAAYNTGGIQGLGIMVLTDKRAESPVINCTGQNNISLSFNYIENGQGTTDNATLLYFDGSAWSVLADPAKTLVDCSGGQGRWAAYTITLPASANNNPNVKIGFGWVNNDDGSGVDPSFAVDDITLSTSTTGIADNQFSSMVIGVSGNQLNISNAEGLEISVCDVLGKEVTKTKGNSTVTLPSKGIYLLRSGSFVKRVAVR